MKKFVTSSVWDAKIKEVYVERETEQSIWINGQRNSKISDYAQYHDTWEAARDYMLAKAQADVDRARTALARVKGYHGNWKGLKKPAEVPDAQ